MKYKSIQNKLLRTRIQSKHIVFLIVFLCAVWVVFFSIFKSEPDSTHKPVYLGTPQVLSGLAAQGESRILNNEGYIVEYSEFLANPLWVAYYVGEKRFKVGKRPRFLVDMRSDARVHYSDYTGSGYTRGHLAPNYVIATRYGRKAQEETFLMTNISPQTSRLNQKAWQRLEEVIANDFSQWHGGFWVITGPVFNDKPRWLKGGKIAIPEAFYKILIKPSESPSSIMVLAFLFPQEASPNASLMSFVTTVDEIEQKTGIDFFSELDDSIENQLESQKKSNPWRLLEVAERPARY